MCKVNCEVRSHDTLSLTLVCFSLLSIYDDCLSAVAGFCENTYSLATYDLTATTVVSLVIEVNQNFNCESLSLFCLSLGFFFTLSFHIYTNV